MDSRIRQSALSQTWKECEVIVVDDGSTDNSSTVLQHFGSAIRRIVQKHKGGNAARNCGLAVSTGQYIQFLDADDLLLPEKVALSASVGTALLYTEDGGSAYNTLDAKQANWVSETQNAGRALRAPSVITSTLDSAIQRYGRP